MYFNGRGLVSTREGPGFNLQHCKNKNGGPYGERTRRYIYEAQALWQTPNLSHFSTTSVWWITSAVRCFLPYWLYYSSLNGQRDFQTSCFQTTISVNVSNIFTEKKKFPSIIILKANQQISKSSFFCHIKNKISYHWNENENGGLRRWLSTMLARPDFDCPRTYAKAEQSDTHL